MNVFFFLLAFSLAALLAPLSATLALGVGAVDIPGGRRRHRRDTPRLGGLAIFVPFALLLSLVYADKSTALSLLLGGGILALLGAADDALSLVPVAKLAVQALAVTVSLWFLPLGGEDGAPPLVYIAAFLFLLILINAVNFLDGLDSLATLLLLPPLTVLILTGGGIAPAALLLVSVMLGFLPFNAPEAELYLGDTGSTVLGLLAGLLALSSAPSPIPVTLLFLLPMLDLVRTVVMRVLRGGSPFMPDRTHLHHLLLSRGYSERTAVALLFAASLCTSLLALLFY